MNAKKTRRVALYARLSVTTEESVSIERQFEAMRKYADARGWEVVVEEKDDGVSATKNRPEDRVGWRAVLDSPERYDAVIVWKVDRLARRVLDFLHADEALRGRGAGIVAVEDPVDMTTAQGRAFATMLAVFGEMEAAAISARVTAARRALVHAGRRAGGRPPYGFRNVENPEGPGYVLGHDPETIDVVRRMVEEALDGASLYAVCRGLDADGIAPREHGNRKGARWVESGVDVILRSPALAGLTPYQGDVVRDRDGLPVVDESVAIMTTEERRQLLRVLDERKKPGSRPGHGKPALLSGVVRCGRCAHVLYRATAAGKGGGPRLSYYRCQNRECPGSIGASRARLEEAIVEEFLRVAGRLPVVEVVEEGGGDSLRLSEIEAAIEETTEAMRQDGADVLALVERLGTLKDLRATARAEVEEEVRTRDVYTGQTFADAWEETEDVAERNTLLRRALAAVYVEPTTKRGNTFDRDRLVYRWAGSPEAEIEGL